MRKEEEGARDGDGNSQQRKAGQGQGDVSAMMEGGGERKSAPYSPSLPPLPSLHPATVPPINKNSFFFGTISRFWGWQTRR